MLRRGEAVVARRRRLRNGAGNPFSLSVIVGPTMPRGRLEVSMRGIRDYLLACFLDSFETNKIRCKIHVTYQFVVAQPNVPAITAPLFHGKPREETDTSRPHPTATPPTPQLLYSPHTTEGRLPVGTSSLPKKETACVSKINPSAFKGKNFVTNSL